MKSLLFKACLLLSVLSLYACGGGGGDDDGATPGTNACPLLGLETRVINGATCSESGSPIVRIYFQGILGDVSICSGTLLTSDDVLTAAHCLFGGVVRALVEVDGRTVTVRDAVSHPQATTSSGIAAVFNDAAILKLSSPLSGQPTLPIIASQDIAPGDIFSIFGYGLDENQEIGVLQSGEMKADTVTENHISASYNGTGSNSCNGDSGGPAVFTTSNGVTGVVGVVSTGIQTDCLEGDVTSYANVQESSILDFILQQVPDARVE